MASPADRSSGTRLASYWPLADLRLRLTIGAGPGSAGSLELRLPEADDLAALAALAEDGAVVGTQGMSAKNYAILREVGTGSWLGRQHQGQGTGTAMRAAVLALAFDGLGADYATSGAFTDNAASLGVSRKLGYAEDGIARHAIRGRPADERRLRIDRATWQAAGGAAGLGLSAVVIEGLEPCLPLFGMEPAAAG